MADGEVSFSGRAGGYDWLIIVDHPKPNPTSLYGHLSPSRWGREEVPVGKGDLLACLGDPHENGGSRKKPVFLLISAGVCAALGWYIGHRCMQQAWILYAAAATLAAGCAQVQLRIRSCR